MKKLVLAILMGLALMGCNSDGTPDGFERIKNIDLVGYYNLHHSLPDGTPVFRLTTPRGVEWCVGRENLQYSLDVYREEGYYGQHHESVADY